MATVYKYLSPDLTECYVGSTVDEDNRKSSHKCGSNGCYSKLLFEKYGYDNCIYVVLEVCSIEEQFIREQWWQDHAVGAVNDRRAFMTEEERIEQHKACKKAYYEANKEELNARMRAYTKAHYEENKEQIKAKKKAYREANKEQINAKNRAHYEANKEQINAKRRIKSIH